MAAWAAGGALAWAASGQTTPPATAPSWVVRLEPGVEWADRVGRGEAEALMVVTRDARLHLFDPATGRPRLAEPLKVRRGVRAATSGIDHPVSTHVAYAFDRHGVWAIRLFGSVGLVWQYGDGPSDAGFDDDPEVLTGWTDAEVTDAGLLVLNSDGRLVLLSLGDGRVRWQVDLGRLPTTALHASGDATVVLWKAAGKTRAAFVRLADARPTPRIRDLDDPWPIWSTPCGDGLLTLSPHEAAVWPWEGPPRRLALPLPNVRASCASIRVGGRGPTRDPVLLVADGARVAAMDPQDGRTLWWAEGAPGEDFVTLAMHDDRCIAMGSRGFIVLDAGTGRVLVRDHRPAPARLLAMHATDNDVYALYSLAGPTSNQTNTLANSLAELIRLNVPAASTTRPATARAALWLNLPPRWLDTLWTDRRVVFVGGHGLSAYELP